MNWTREHEAELRRLAMEARFFFTEIAEKMGLKVQSVRWKAKQLGIPSTQKTLKNRMGKWNAKHAHLREKLLTYYLNHSAEQCQKKFKLTPSEFKSCLTYGYRDPTLKHLRKETRRHDSWSTRELKFLLQHCGIMPRDWIGKKLKRGTPVCVKERMEKLGISSRTLNGITLSQFILAFGERPSFTLKTKAGPGRGGTPTYFQIVPWVWLDQEIKMRKLKTTRPFRKVIATMALFQEWIFDGDALKKLKRIAKKKIEAAP